MDADSLPGARGPYSLPRRLRRVLHAVALGCPPEAVHVALACSQSAGRGYVEVLREYKLIPCHGFAPPYMPHATPLTPKGVEWLSKNPREKSDYVYDWPGRPRDSRESLPPREQAMVTAIQNAREALDRAGISRGRSDTIAQRIDVLAARRDAATRYSHERAAVERHLLRYGIQYDTFPEGLRQVEAKHREQMREHTDKIDARVEARVREALDRARSTADMTIDRLERSLRERDTLAGEAARVIDGLKAEIREIRRTLDGLGVPTPKPVSLRGSADPYSLPERIMLLVEHQRSTVAGGALMLAEILRTLDDAGYSTRDHRGSLMATLAAALEGGEGSEEGNPWHEALHPWADAHRLAALMGESIGHWSITGAPGYLGANVAAEHIAVLLTAVERSPEALAVVHAALAEPEPEPAPMDVRLYGFDARGKLSWESSFPLDGKTALMEFPHQPSTARVEIDALPSGWRIQGNVTVREIGADSQSGVHVYPIASEPGCGVSCDLPAGTAAHTVVVNLRAVEG